MTSQGSAQGRFTRAIKQRNLFAAELAARELRGLNLHEALDLVALIAEARPDRLEPAAIRWHGRLEIEARSLTLAESRFALAALERYPVTPSSRTPSGGCFVKRARPRFDESNSVPCAIPAPHIQTLYDHRALIGVPPITLDGFAQEVGSVWRNDDRPSEHADDWLDLFRTTRDDLGRYLKDAPDELPEGELEIWRGVSAARYAHGRAWTLDREKAVWFANRNPVDGERPHLYRARAKCEDVLAYFNTRQESEIVIDPSKVQSLIEQPI